MRLLLSFIICSFFYFADNNCEAAPRVQKKTSFYPESGSSKCSDAALTISRNTVHLNPNSQHRSLPGLYSDHAHFNFGYDDEDGIKAKLQASYNFCVPIGQKLLYPKHYFW